jgi:hypothetical protein
MRAVMLFLGFSALLVLDIKYFDGDGVRSLGSMIGMFHTPT